MFNGVYTAIVTPFLEDGRVDFDRFRKLIDFQIAGGVDGIVPVGTTGESPTLNFDEHHQVIEATVEACRGRVKVIAGTGGNATAEALELTQHAKEAGADGTLQVTPYYNKPNLSGLVQHFATVADVGLPVVLYNVPGRSSLEISLQAVAELESHPHIVAIKEAGGSVDRVSQLVRQSPSLEVLSGDDALTLPMLVVGAVGVISVASNIVPERVCNLVHTALRGDWETARREHGQLHRLFSDLFLSTNPIPVKTALARMGKVEDVFRLPLSSMEPNLEALLEDCLRAYGLLS